MNSADKRSLRAERDAYTSAKVFAELRGLDELASLLDAAADAANRELGEG